LGSIRQKAGKTIHAWGWEGDADPSAIASNLMRTEWPRGSGRWIEFPEVDRCMWANPATARAKMNPAQAELVSRLEGTLVGNDTGP
jgi:predicted NUDIX family NTP pyrophosphohydrolase